MVSVSLLAGSEVHHGLLRREKSFCQNFREVFRSFREVLRSFREFFEVFGRVRTHSDPFGPIGTRSEAISVWTFSIFFEIFWIFESFFNVSGRFLQKTFFTAQYQWTTGFLNDRLRGGK